MKNFVVLVEIDLGAKTEEIALERVKRIPFGNNDCDFRIVGIKEGSIPPGTSLYDVEPNLVNEQNEGDVAIRLISE